MPSKQKLVQNNTRLLVLRLSRVYFIYIAVYILSVIIFDSWNLLAHEAVTQRWSLAVGFLIINTVTWYICRLQLKNPFVYRVLLVVLLVAGILFAAMNVYWQRGMASKAVLLFMVPLISAGLARSRSLLLATTSLAVAAYSMANVKYFYDFYGQGFRVELYGETFFYSAMFFVVAGLLMIAFRPAKD